MFLEGKDYLSIWEIGHRWAGFDPDATDPNDLPEQVRYLIHKLIEGYLSDDLKLRRASGYRIPRENQLFFIWNLNFWLNQLWRCLTKNVFDKNRLSGCFVRRSELLKMCVKEDVDPPAFWIKQRAESPVAKSTINNRPKDEETDRLVCQAIARTYWSIDPQIHPAHMARAKAIHLYGNGKQYKDPETVRNWISEVDPQKDQRKSGRPASVPYLIDLETGALSQK